MNPGRTADLPQARPAARPQERRHRGQAEPDRIPGADERARASSIRRSQSVKEFADQFSGSQDIRIMLVELLRASSREDEAHGAAREARRGHRGACRRARSVRRRSARRAPARSDEHPEPRPIAAHEPAARLPRHREWIVSTAAPTERAGPRSGRGAGRRPHAHRAGGDGLDHSDDLIIEPLPDVIDESLEDVPGLETTSSRRTTGSHSRPGLDRGRGGIRRARLLDTMEEPDLTDSLLETTDEDLVVSEELAVTEEPRRLARRYGSRRGAPSAIRRLPTRSGRDAGARSVAELEDRVLDDPDESRPPSPAGGAILAEGTIRSGRSRSSSWR